MAVWQEVPGTAQEHELGAWNLSGKRLIGGGWHDPVRGACDDHGRRRDAMQLVVECFDGGGGVPRQIRCAPAAIPSGSVWRDGVDRAGQRRTQGVPITCATGLSVQKEDSARAAQAPGGPLVGP